MKKSAIIIPCYNEAKRLKPTEFLSFLKEYPKVHLIFVNDGSKDGTLEILNSMVKQSSQCHVIDQEKNQGKAFAVYSGVNMACKGDYDNVGFWDADLATPLDMIPKFCKLLDDDEHKLVFGCRVQRLGSNIKRNPMRHYQGRFFATLISRILILPIYDTQCGAKIFKNNDDIRKAFAKPFYTKWIFDVELISRLLKINTSERESFVKTIYEYPLEIWNDVDGSKVTMKDGFRALLDLFKIYCKRNKPYNTENTE